MRSARSCSSTATTWRARAMRHAKKGRKLGREAQHRKALLGTMAGQLIQHGRIKTTAPKAKELRGVVDRLINTAKKDDLAARRQAVKVLKDKSSVRIGELDPATEPYLVRKRVGMLFQNPENGLVAPFVEDDVAFGLENLGVPREEMRERVARAIRTVGLEGFERREPHTLSGGEKQRVALAGLLVAEPEILVLDEPTSMLDSAGRMEVLEYLHALHSEKTVLHVTHHLEELTGADRIYVLNGGELVADETPERFFSNAELLRENRLVLPVVPRLALGLGFPPAKLRTPEELAQAILTRTQSGTRTL